jgi:hypothetical protein
MSATQVDDSTSLSANWETDRTSHMLIALDRLSGGEQNPVKELFQCYGCFAICGRVRSRANPNTARRTSRTISFQAEKLSPKNVNWK